MGNKLFSNLRTLHGPESERESQSRKPHVPIGPIHLRHRALDQHVARAGMTMSPSRQRCRVGAGGGLVWRSGGVSVRTAGLLNHREPWRAVLDHSWIEVGYKCCGWSSLLLTRVDLSW